jgi:hypothetical protein
MSLVPATPVLSTLPPSTPTAEIDNATNKGIIRSALGAMENTNTAVNAAIATDPAATRAAAGVLESTTGGPTNGLPSRIQITGLLFDNAAKALGFPLLYLAPSGAWTDDGKDLDSLGYESVVFYDSTRWAAEVKENGVAIARWQAAEGSQPSPELANWASSAVAPASGVPSFSLLAAIPKTPIAPYFRDQSGKLWYPSGASPNHVWVNTTPRTDEFIDDFSIYPNGTVIGEGFQPMLGKPYLLQGTAPTVLGGRLQEADPNAEAPVWYLGQELSEPVYQFGAEAIIESVDSLNDNDQTLTFLIMPEYVWLDKLIHIRIETRSIIVDLSTRSGVDGFKTFTLVNPRPIRIKDKKFTINGSITGNTLRISVAGSYHELTDPRIGQINGRFIFFEQFGSTASNRIRYYKVWANALSENGVSAQDRSIALSQLSNGYLREFPLRLSVGDSNLFGRAPSCNALAPLLDSVSSIVNSSDANLWERFLQANTLTPVGSRYWIKANGRFGANGNNKRVRFNMAGQGPDTGVISQNAGTWDLEVIVSASTSASHLCYGKITLSSGAVYTARWSFNNGVGTTFGCTIKATGVAAGDVILDHAFGDWIRA